MGRISEKIYHQSQLVVLLSAVLNPPTADEPRLVVIDPLPPHPIRLSPSVLL
jgi:hypothetical protein